VERRGQGRERIALDADLEAGVDDLPVRLPHHHAAGDPAMANERRQQCAERARHARLPSERVARSSDRSNRRLTYPRGTVRGAATSSTPPVLGAIATLAVSASNTICRHRPSPRWRIARPASSLTPESWAPTSAATSRPSSVRYWPATT